jgi:hypothetical protein
MSLLMDWSHETRLTVNTGNCWRAAFAFELINTVFFLWMIVMAWKVHRDVHHP